MPSKEQRNNNSKDLRRRSEEIFHSNHAALPDNITSEKTLRILHELQIHQIALEMQNEELCKAQNELEYSRQRYFDLYGLASAGYVTLNEKDRLIWL